MTIDPDSEAKVETNPQQIRVWVCPVCGRAHPIWVAECNHGEAVHYGQPQTAAGSADWRQTT